MCWCLCVWKYVCVHACVYLCVVYLPHICWIPTSRSCLMITSSIRFFWFSTVFAFFSDRALLGMIVLADSYFLQHLEYVSPHPLLISGKKLAISLIGLPLKVTWYFSLANFKIFSFLFLMCGKDFFFVIFCFCWSSLCLGSAGLLNLGVHVFSTVRKFVLFLFPCLSLSSFSMPLAFILFHDRKASDTDIDLLPVLRTPTLLHTSSFLPACDILRPVFKFQGSFCCLICLLRLSIKFFLKNLIYWYFWKIIIHSFSIFPIHCVLISWF